MSTPARPPLSYQSQDAPKSSLLDKEDLVRRVARLEEVKRVGDMLKKRAKKKRRKLEMRSVRISIIFFYKNQTKKSEKRKARNAKKSWKSREVCAKVLIFILFFQYRKISS
jgi:chromatin segregation and condensation protein Rec8/ScpA/Scc1 (kleisin family)